MEKQEAKIYKAIPKIMEEIGSIGKDRKNAQQGYQFRGIDDVYNAAQAALVKYGVFCAPEVLSMVREQLPSKSGGTLLYTILTVKYTFFAEDGSSVSVTVTGEGMDSGDKSCNKAMSGAQKYAFLQTFCIPTSEPKDSEADNPEVGKKSEAPKAASGKPVDEKKLDRATDSQIGEIKAKRDMLKLGKEDLADISKKITGKISAADMTAADATKLIVELDRLLEAAKVTA